MTNLRLRQRTRLTALVLALLMSALGLVGWWALQQTQRTAEQLQTRTLADVSVAMDLAERAAQIAALGPYIGESAVPFQLQAERTRLNERFARLDERVEELSDESVRTAMIERIDRLRDELDQLTEQVSEELFIREDLMVLRFELADWQQQYLPEATGQGDAALATWLQILRQVMASPPQPPLETEQTLSRLRSQISAQAEQLALTPAADAMLTNLLDETGERLRVRAGVAANKQVLFASTRSQSEALTEFVQTYVSDVQRSVGQQRATLDDAVLTGYVSIIMVALLAALALLVSVRFLFRMTRDLDTVTQDMTLLANGQTEAPSPVIQRNDEIGELADTFDVFRRASIEMTKVSRDLRAQTQLLETVLDTMNDGLSVFSADQTLLAWNQRYLELFGLSSRQVRRGVSLEAVQKVMNRDVYRNLSLDNRALDMDAVNDLRGSQAQIFERHYHSGKVIEFRSQPMPDGGFVTLYSDLTDRRAVEQQLIQAQKMEVLGQLTGGVAHDFNNLLSALIGNLQLLQASTRLPETERRYTDRALGVAERGANLVERLLAFSRKQQLHPEAVEVGALLEGMYDLIEYSVAPDIDVALGIDSQAEYWVWVDPSQLENALLNLVINSSAAMHGGGQLWIRVRQHQQPNQPAQVEIEVADTGVGMTPEIMNRIWEPFYTTKPVGQGSGLGLSLVYGFIKQSGGDVLLESQPGKGTRIRLYLPICDTGAGTAGTASTPELTPVVLPPKSGVLLVEDDVSVQRSLRDGFRLLAIPVHTVDSAEAALDWLSSNASTVGAVFSDINLAGELSGVDLSVRIAELWPEIPVVLSSGLPREHLSRHFALADSAILLAKPVRLETLKQVFRHDTE